MPCRRLLMPSRSLLERKLLLLLVLATTSDRLNMGLSAFNKPLRRLCELSSLSGCQWVGTVRWAPKWASAVAGQTPQKVECPFNSGSRSLSAQPVT